MKGSHLASILGSSPSTLNAGLGVTASSTYEIVLRGKAKEHRLKTHEVVVTVRTVLVAFLEFRGVFPEGFLALLADERHLRRLGEVVRLFFRMAFRAIKPLLAAGRADGNLGVQDVLATVF